MQCRELDRILESEPDAPLTAAVAEHVAACAECQALEADFSAIGAAALDLAQEEVAPPEWLWARIRAELEAEGRIREPQAVRAPVHTAWWSVFQRPAFAGAVLGVLLGVAGYLGMNSRGIVSTAQQDADTQSAPAFVAESQTTGSLDATEASIESLPQQDPEVAQEVHHDLGVIDDFIVVAQKSVREQPDNEMAREYLYDAYQQKAQLLEVATDRSEAGGAVGAPVGVPVGGR
jgi:hypothetical protein